MSASILSLTRWKFYGENPLRILRQLQRSEKKYRQTRGCRIQSRPHKEDTHPRKYSGEQSAVPAGAGSNASSLFG